MLNFILFFFHAWFLFYLRDQCCDSCIAEYFCDVKAIVCFRLNVCVLDVYGWVTLSIALISVSMHAVCMHVCCMYVFQARARSVCVLCLCVGCAGSHVFVFVETYFQAMNLRGPICCCTMNQAKVTTPTYTTYTHTHTYIYIRTHTQTQHTHIHTHTHTHTRFFSISKFLPPLTHPS